jgi:ribA/ribD-fused uncharacterized protein
MEQDILFFFSKSADKAPGKGKNERTTTDYSELSHISNWRKVLSNFYVSPFTWKNRTWNSVEHAFQSRKIALVDPERAEWFNLESGHAIGKGDGNMARKNRKLVILGHEKLAEWNSIKSSVMEDILYAKFSQVNLARRVLLSTKHAVLLHGVRGPAQQQFELERVRSRLNK